MKKNEDLVKDNQNVIVPESLMNGAGRSVNSKGGYHLRKFITLAGLAGIGLFFTGCFAGYVATEPAYTVYARPPQPSNTHLWIEGNWGWNNQSHVYVQKTGYWEQPRQGRTYVSGHWQSTPRGKTWSKGYWQSKGKNKNSHNR